MNYNHNHNQTMSQLKKLIVNTLDTIYTATLTPNQVTGAYVSDNNGPSFGSCFCRIQRYNLVSINSNEIIQNKILKF